MILDEQGLFSNNQAVTADCASENILDLGAREVSFGTPVEVFIQVTEDFNNLEALSIKVQTCNEETFSSPLTLIEQTVNIADLIKGAVSNIKFLPKGNLGFVRLYYTVSGGSAPTTGKILAGVVDGVQESFHNI